MALTPLLIGHISRNESYAVPSQSVQSSSSTNQSGQFGGQFPDAVKRQFRRWSGVNGQDSIQTSTGYRTKLCRANLESKKPHKIYWEERNCFPVAESVSWSYAYLGAIKYVWQMKNTKIAPKVKGQSEISPTFNKFWPSLWDTFLPSYINFSSVVLEILCLQTPARSIAY